MAAPEAAKSDGDAEEVANLRQASCGKRDILPSVGKVDMAETFLGTIWGDVAANHFFLYSDAFCFLFSPWESCFFFVVWGGVFWMFVSA